MAGWIKWRTASPSSTSWCALTMVNCHRSAAISVTMIGPPGKPTMHGKPRDPWQFLNYLPMMDDDGKLFTFTTSSRGGINTIVRFGKVVTPLTASVIRTSIRSSRSASARTSTRTKEYGRIKYPEFIPAGYEPKAKFLAALEAAGVAASADGFAQRRRSFTAASA